MWALDGAVLDDPAASGARGQTGRTVRARVLPEREPDARSGHRLPTAVPGGHTEGARCQLAGSPRPRHTEHLEAIPMQRLHRTVRALRRLGARLHTWRDEIAARPVDPDGWWR
ncbi:hypothetical protein Athai_68020 [Actinocatenispora thailandica]|uniref:Uncharacterized protein n=1 Tax=Actinocatenispora thailandica TaxID=227318 RepID=A0A7R7DWQ5_9ACTN|nr:hypothetical protein Athai_68020 [Actinocatenispora thailandica]